MAVIFLTGATGFVGGATLVRLLEDPRVEQVLVLVRARDTAHARERVAASLARFEVTMPTSGRLQVVPGTLGELRISSEDRARVTHVLHAAAHTSFRSVRTARETNVAGTGELARVFAGAPALERFLYVGTAYRLGVAEVRHVEEDMPSSTEHLVEYTRSKAEAEAVLEGMGLPLVIARPSIVVGHTRLGVTPSASLFWYYPALAVAGVSPFSEDRKRDIVPVDWAAAALVHLLLSHTLRFDRYHVSAGENAAETWGGDPRGLLGPSFAVRRRGQPAGPPGLEGVLVRQLDRPGPPGLRDVLSALV